MFVMTEDRGKTPEKGVPDYRKGRKTLTVWVNPNMIYALKIVAAERQMLQQDALIEALNDFLEKHGKARIE